MTEWWSGSNFPGFLVATGFTALHFQGARTPYKPDDHEYKVGIERKRSDLLGKEWFALVGLFLFFPFRRVLRENISNEHIKSWSNLNSMSEKELIRIDEIPNLIHTIRGVQVMLDMDLAALYGVETRVLNQAVKRNRERFPERFCFQITDPEFEILKSQIVISSWKEWNEWIKELW